MRRKPRPIRLTPKLKPWHKIAPAVMARMADAHASRRFPFDCALVRALDLVGHFGITKEAAATFLKANGAQQLARTTQGGGVPAMTLWSLRDHERLAGKSARARVAIYVDHRDRHPFDPLEL
jgi:hypothetical protein